MSEEPRQYMEAEVITTTGTEMIRVDLSYLENNPYPWRATTPEVLDRYGDPYEGCAKDRGWGPDVAALECLMALVKGAGVVLVTVSRLPRKA